VKSVSSSFSKNLSHEDKAKAKDSTLKAKAKTKDFKIVLEDEDLSSRTPTLPTEMFVSMQCENIIAIAAGSQRAGFKLSHTIASILSQL